MAHTGIASTRLMEREMEGGKIDFGNGTAIVQDRLLVGVNLSVQEEQLLFCSRYSLSLKANPSPIKDLLIEVSILSEVLAMTGDRKESLVKRYESCLWLDPIHVHRLGNTFG